LPFLSSPPTSAWKFEIESRRHLHLLSIRRCRAWNLQDCLTVNPSSDPLSAQPARAREPRYYLDGTTRNRIVPRSIWRQGVAEDLLHIPSLISREEGDKAHSGMVVRECVSMDQERKDENRTGRTLV